MAADITTYTDPACPHCRQLKEYLDRCGVPYRDRDVTRDEAAAQELMRLNAPGVPVTVVNGEVLIGFNQARLDEALRKNGVASGPGG